MERYIPHPKNTRNVTLPDEVLALAEQLARNTHEVWAAQRLKDGWVWGPARDDAKKQHPCLVPYEELPFSSSIVPILFAGGRYRPL